MKRFFCMLEPGHPDEHMLTMGVTLERIYTEAELQSAVAGAYRAAADEITHCDMRFHDRDSIEAKVRALTPASAQKAFADAVAAEVARLTEEKERLRVALESIGESGHQANCAETASDKRHCPTCIAQAALTPAAGGETRENNT